MPLFPRFKPESPRSARRAQSADHAQSPQAELQEFETALLDHAPALLAFARRLTRTSSGAEDLVQDTFVKALRARDQYEPGTHLRAWLLRILKNTFINRYHRGALERRVLDGPEAEPLLDGWVGAATLRGLRDPETELLRPTLERELLAALDELPVEFRTAVMLVDVEGLVYREAAEVIGCPVGTVMSRLHRGRRLLKAKLLDHARDAGIIGLEPAVGPAAAHSRAEHDDAPIQLASYRARRGRPS